MPHSLTEVHILEQCTASMFRVTEQDKTKNKQNLLAIGLAYSSTQDGAVKSSETSRNFYWTIWHHTYFGWNIISMK
jgi:hypothetical protein